MSKVKPSLFCIICSSELLQNNSDGVFDNSVEETPEEFNPYASSVPSEVPGHLGDQQSSGHEKHLPKNTELFEILCSYLEVSMSMSLAEAMDMKVNSAKERSTFCSECVQTVSEIFSLHQKLEEIRREISERVGLIEQTVVALESSKGRQKDVKFVEEFRQKVKKRVKNREGVRHETRNEVTGQGPPYLHIVEIQPSMMNQYLNRIKIQSEEHTDDDDGSFTAEDIEIYPFHDNEESEVDTKDQIDEDSGADTPSTSQFLRKLRPRVDHNRSKLSSVSLSRHREVKDLGQRVVKSEPESETETEEANEFDIYPDPTEALEDPASDADDPDVSFSNNSEDDENDSDSDDDDWGSAPKKRSRSESISRTSKPKTKRVRIRDRRVKANGLGKWDIEFSPDGRMFYEKIEIFKTETKSGWTLKCGECSREFFVDPKNLKKRESPYYRLKVHMKGSHLGIYNCKICSKPMSCSKSLSRHTERHHGIGIKSDAPRAHCEICEKPFKTPSKDFMFSHTWTHKSEDEKSAAIKAGIKPPLTYAEKLEAMKLKQPEPFQCSQCGKTFHWKSLLKKHESRVHVPDDQKVKSFSCHICKKLFLCQGDLTAHKRFVCEKDKLARLYFCSFCDKKFPTKEDFAKHERKHTKEKPFQCVKCLKSYSQEKVLKRHIRDCKGVEGNSGKYYQGVEMFHEVTETGFTVKCGCCDYVVENIKSKQARCDTYRKIHLHIQGKHLGAFKCRICDKKLSDPKGLKNHLKTHDNEDKAPKHNCAVCGKPFKTNKNKKFLQSHLWTHMSEEERQERISAGDTPPLTYAERMEMLKSKQDNVFQCDQCGKTFAWQCQLKKHERVHSGDTKERRTHQCAACGKFYSTADSLHSHVKHVHDKDRVHKWHYCTFCEKKFSHKFAWRKHERSHRKDTLKAFHCHVCSKAFSHEKNLQNHLKQCHPNQEGMESPESTSSHHSGNQNEVTISSGGISLPLGMPASGNSMENGMQQQFPAVPQSHSSTNPVLPPGQHFMAPGLQLPGTSRFYEDGNIFHNFF